MSCFLGRGVVTAPVFPTGKSRRESPAAYQTVLAVEAEASGTTIHRQRDVVRLPGGRKSALTLFMTRVATDDIDPTLSPDNLTVFTDAFDARADFHGHLYPSFGLRQST